MEVVVKKRTDRELVIKVLGEDHTLGNLVAKMALRHPKVELAAYTIEHPLDGQPVIRIITDGSRDPVEVLKEVLKESRNMLDSILNAVKSKLGTE